MIEIDEKYAKRISDRRKQVLLYAKALFPECVTHQGEAKTGLTYYLGLLELEAYRNPGMYHDVNHTYAMLIMAQEIAFSLKMETRERRILFVACLFHDQDHSQGLSNDMGNIACAIKALLHAYRKEAYDSGLLVDLLPLNTEELDLAMAAILCTLHPYRLEPQNDIERCIRDADLSMSMEPDAELFAAGLTKEFRRGGKDVSVTVEEMFQFALSQHFFTPMMQKRVSALRFKVGDIVEPVPGSGYYLRSGASAYNDAVVVSVVPFVLVSRGADMRWSATSDARFLQKAGEAFDTLLAKCMARKDD